MSQAQTSSRERLAEIVRRRWDRLDWAGGLPDDTSVIPDYTPLAGLGLDEAQRIGLNRLFACYVCEQVIHFESYVIDYLRWYPERVPRLSTAVIDRFVAEEVVHSEAFVRLLHRLRPDIYPDEHADPIGALVFLPRTELDTSILKRAPVATFFILTWLFEEIALGVPEAVTGEETAPLFRAVAELHAREEEPHVELDVRVIGELRDSIPSWALVLHSLLALPFMAYFDRRVASAWASIIDRASNELALSQTQRRRLIDDKEMSAADQVGITRFVARLDDVRLPGTGALAWVLRRELRRLS